ncbi:restriction endonuclease [Pseudoflavitalea rhizosphaerae]|uniref:restriction endonuclease n=1 Tax=Pseudoflavitalea rhizosphaerae TaxID=1884793 RepID=UPI000F8CACC6|nr:restriction endonuclease [Pseudoflavitalea rhizosphaerae]
MKYQKISSQALIALKDALANVYWKKKELRQFIELTMGNPYIISTIDWQENTKYESVSQLIDRMAARQDIYLNDLLRLLQESSNIDDFSHLKYWDEKGDLTKRAKESVAKLRVQTKGYLDNINDLNKAAEKRVENIEKVKQSISFAEKLGELKKQFLQLAISTDAQNRGFSLEKLLNELFHLFDMLPKAAFRIRGEQIDGSFTFDNDDYILEAKWQKTQINAGDLYKFGGKISGKLKNTLGLFISLDGYSSECTETGSSIVKSMILMDGQDLMMVFDGRIRLNEMIFIKRRHASDTGEIYYRISGI